MQTLRIKSQLNRLVALADRWLIATMAVCFLVGDLLACLLGCSAKLLLPILLVSAILLVFSLILKKFRLLLVAALLLGYFWCGVDMVAAEGFNYENGRAVELTGEVVEVVQGRENYLTEITAIETDSEYRAYIVECTTDNGWQGRLVVGTYGYDLLAGDKIHLVGNVKTKSSLQNWQMSDENTYFREYGAAGYVQAISGELEVLKPASPNFFAKMVENTREHLYLQMENLPEKQSQLLKGLAFGDKTTMTGYDRNIISQTGVAHVFAVSGLHIGFVIACVLGACKFIGRRLKLPKWLKLTAVVLLTVFYAAICGFTHSVVRALIMGCGATAAAIYYDNYSSRAALVYAAVVCVLIQPFAILNVGFQLSFLATFALLFTYSIWYRWLKHPALATLLSAQIMVTPLVVYDFNILTLSGLLISPIVSTVAGLVVIFGFLAVLFSFVGFSSFFLNIAGLVTAMIYQLCSWAAGLPMSHLIVVKPPLALVLICYGLLFIAYGLWHWGIKEKQVQNNEK